MTHEIRRQIPADRAAHAAPNAMTVDDLAAKLAQIAGLGFGGAQIMLPDGRAIHAVDLVTHGEVVAHFVLEHHSLN